MGSDKKEKMPKQYRKLSQYHPKVMEAVNQLGDAVHEGPLDEKTAHLIQLAASAAIRSEGGVHSHTRRAIEAGATPAEVRHALILLTSTMGFPMMSAALSWANDDLGD